MINCGGHAMIFFGGGIGPDDSLTILKFIIQSVVGI